MGKSKRRLSAKWVLSDGIETASVLSSKTLVNHYNEAFFSKSRSLAVIE